MQKILTYVLEEQKSNLEIETLNSSFDIKFISANEEKRTEEMLWKQIVSFVRFAKRKREDKFILIRCLEGLESIVSMDWIKVMTDAVDFNTKILISNTSSMDATLIPVSHNLFWTDSITDFQFLIIYGSCFDLILNEDFSPYNTLDECLENITSNKMLIYPMVKIDSDAKIDHQKIHKRMERLVYISSYLQENKYKLQQMIKSH